MTENAAEHRLSEPWAFSAPVSTCCEATVLKRILSLMFSPTISKGPPLPNPLLQRRRGGCTHRQFAGPECQMLIRRTVCPSLSFRRDERTIRRHAVLSLSFFGGEGWGEEAQCSFFSAFLTSAVTSNQSRQALMSFPDAPVIPLHRSQ